MAMVSLGNKLEKKIYDHNRWATRRKEYLLKFGPCKSCGSWKDLEFHHRTPELKVRDIHWSWTRCKIEKELAKCDVLCKACHLAVVPFVHGTIGCYLNAHCRCLSCREAWKLYMRKYRSNRKGDYLGSN